MNGTWEEGDPGLTHDQQLLVSVLGMQYEQSETISEVHMPDANMPNKTND